MSDVHFSEHLLKPRYDFAIPFLQGILVGHVNLSDYRSPVKWTRKGSSLSANNESGTDAVQDFTEYTDPDNTSDYPLKPDQKNHAYQIFFGMNRADMRKYIEYSGTRIGDLDDKKIGNIQEDTKIYWLEGWESPWHYPTIASEFFALKDLTVKFATLNRSPVAFTYADLFIINRLEVTWYDARNKEDERKVEELVYGNKPLYVWGFPFEQPDYNAESHLDVKLFRIPLEDL